MSGGKEVLAPDDMGYALQRIVDDAGEVIAGAEIFARNHGVAEDRRRRRNAPCLALGAAPFFGEA